MQPCEDLFGSYVVWDNTHEVWIRSGKAISIATRIRKHSKDKDRLDSKIYEVYRCEWDRLEWCNSFALRQDDVAAAASAMFVSEKVKKKLEAAKFGGKNKKAIDREYEMMAYLSELVDDMLMDKRHTWCSEAPGFEGPLGVHCVSKV